jgi:NAD(P)-dependent dehydrogenase (short-subunit alcohol dehydrogenase family)
MAPTAFDFSGKVVLVTGVGRAGQIGNAVALGMARTGDNVAAAGQGAAYVEMEDLTRGVLALAVGGPGAPTGEIVPIAPRGAS